MNQILCYKTDSGVLNVLMTDTTHRPYLSIQAHSKILSLCARPRLS